MKRRWGVWMALMVWIGIAAVGCANEGPRSSSMIGAVPYPPPDLPHRAASSHVELYWKCERVEPNTLQLDGMARNPWTQQEIRFLEFDLVGMDRNGRAVSQAHAEAPNFLLRTNQITRFQLAVRTTGRESRYDLHYQYRFQDVEMEGRLAGPPPAGLRLAQSAFLFQIRDACNETRHLAK